MLRREDLMACGLDEVAAAELLLRFEVLVGSPEARWREVARRLLRPDHPFALHQLLYEVVYDGELGPVFFPEPADIEGANATALQRELDLPSYDALFAWSVDEWEVFWHKTVARLGIRLQKPYERFVDLAQGPTAPEWLAGAEMNIAESCFQADGEQTAIVFQREGGPLEHMSYTALEGLCDRVASGLVAAGFVPGDRIAVDMPMTAEAVAIYLGIVKAGCAVVAIADSFAAAEIATRLKIGSAQAVFTQDVILRGGRELPLYSRLVEAQAPRAIVLSGRVDGTLAICAMVICAGKIFCGRATVFRRWLVRLMRSPISFFLRALRVPRRHCPGRIFIRLNAVPTLITTRTCIRATWSPGRRTSAG